MSDVWRVGRWQWPAHSRGHLCCPQKLDMDCACRPAWQSPLSVLWWPRGNNTSPCPFLTLLVGAVAGFQARRFGCQPACKEKELGEAGRRSSCEVWSAKPSSTQPCGRGGQASSFCLGLLPNPFQFQSFMWSLVTYLNSISNEAGKGRWTLDCSHSGAERQWVRTHISAEKWKSLGSEGPEDSGVCPEGQWDKALAAWEGMAPRSATTPKVAPAMWPPLALGLAEPLPSQACEEQSCRL